MKGMTIKLPDDLEKKIIYESKQRGISKSSLVREALALYLNDTNGADSGPSVYDLAKDLIGSVSGPGDLSTNPKYMAGYGKSRRGSVKGD
jgi:hypothetical protein